ncbi:MAG: tail fiber protein [Chloroflexota bacterium]
MSDPFIAEIRMFGGDFAPRGWASCDGRLLPISQHTSLWSLIGKIYGGDGRSTMALPNLQGRAPMHPGNGPGLSVRGLGDRVGSETIAVTQPELPSHTHPVQGMKDGNLDTPAGNYIEDFWYDPTPNADYSSTGVGTAGGGVPHNNVQPYLVLNFIIALVGLFPTRN